MRTFLGDGSKKKGLILLMLMVAWFPVGRAVWAEGPGIKVLTLKEALQIADERNKDIQRAKEYRTQLEGRYIEERAAALPQLQITGGYSRSRDESQKELYRGALPFEGETWSVDAALSQPLYTFGRIGAALRAAKVGLATADDQLRIYRQATRREVSAAFYDVLLSKELYALAQKNREQKRRHLEEARKKYTAGVATEYDVLAAEVAVENAMPEVIRRENLIRTSLDRLRFLLGFATPEIDVEGSLQKSLSSYPTYEEAVGLAGENRPELADLRKRVDIAKELVKIYEAGNLPRVDFKAGYGWKDVDMKPLKGDGPAWTAGIYLSFPFFDGLRTKGKVIQAKSEVASLRIDEAKLLDSIALQVREALNACREATEIVQALSGTVRQAERLLRMAEKGFEYGVKTKLDVDDAELNWVQAKGNLARARRDYIVALVNYDWVMGILGERA